MNEKHHGDDDLIDLTGRPHPGWGKPKSVQKPVPPDSFVVPEPGEAIFHVVDSPPTVGEAGLPEVCRDETCSTHVMESLGADLDGSYDERLPSMETRKVQKSTMLKFRSDWVATRSGKLVLLVAILAVLSGGIWIFVALWNSSPIWAIAVGVMTLLLLDVIRQGMLYGENSMYKRQTSGFLWPWPWL
jgi:hypothetical protein